MEVSSEENREEEAEGVRISKKRLLQGKSRERELIDASHRTKKEKQLLKCNLDMIRTAGRCYSLPGGDEKLGGRAGRRGPRLVADQRLHHKCVLEVTDAVAVLRLTFVDA